MAALLAGAYLADMVVVELMPQAIGALDVSIVVPGVHRVSRMDQHAIQGVRLSLLAPVGHEGPQVQLSVKVNLHQQ